MPDGSASRGRAEAAAVGSSSQDGPDRQDGLDWLVGYRLRRAHGRFVESWREFFGALGLSLTPVQGGVLMLIDRHAGLTQTELARRLGIEAPTLHENVKRLIEAGWVGRKPLAHDKRSHGLELTPEGAAIARLICERVPDQEASALARLTPAERADLRRLLGRMLDWS